MDEVRTEYKRLVRIHHPDRGGDTVIMQAINVEYQAYTNPGPRQQRLYPKSEQPKPKQTKFTNSYEFWTQQARSAGQQSHWDWKGVYEQAARAAEAQARREENKIHAWYASMCHKGNAVLKAFGITRSKFDETVVRFKSITVLHKPTSSKISITMDLRMREVVISGQTFDTKHIYKNLGFGWDAKDKYWYWSPEYRSSSKDEHRPGEEPRYEHPGCPSMRDVDDDEEDQTDFHW